MKASGVSGKNMLTVIPHRPEGNAEAEEKRKRSPGN